MPNTCKSSELILFGDEASGGRVSNTWATCLIEGNSLPKGRLIPHKIVASHEVAIKGAIRYEMGPRIAPLIATMGETLMQQRRVSDDGLRVVKLCLQGR